jgi:hypothetical protein
VLKFICERLAKNGMVDIDADWHQRGDVTHVRATIRNDRTTPQRVAIRTTFDGPVWAPSDRPLPRSEWDGSIWSGRIEPRCVRGLGFATPTALADPPLELVSIERAGSDSTRRCAPDFRQLDKAVPPSTIVE